MPTNWRDLLWNPQVTPATDGRPDEEVSDDDRAEEQPLDPPRGASQAAVDAAVRRVE